jgi:hypothetical protein
VAAAVEHMGEAVARDPLNTRLRVEHARVLFSAAMFRECLAQLDAAEEIDASLYPESTLRLSADERVEIRRIRRTAEQMLAAGAR